MNKVQDYIEKMEAEFGEDWTYYLPVYFYEQRKLIEEWGFNVQGLSDEQVGTMFQEVLMNELNGNFPIKDVELKGPCSTCSILEWILMHGCPPLDATHFRFPNDKILSGLFARMPRAMVVSSIPEDEVYANKPASEWHEPIKGIHRFAAPSGGLWYAEISGRYYYITD